MTISVTFDEMSLKKNGKESGLDRIPYEWYKTSFGTSKQPADEIWICKSCSVKESCLSCTENNAN